MTAADWANVSLCSALRGDFYCEWLAEDMFMTIALRDKLRHAIQAVDSISFIFRETT